MHIAQSSCKCSYTAFRPDAQATPSDLQRQLQLAVYFYRWRVTYLGRSTSHRQLFIGQQKRVISRTSASSSVLLSH